MAYTDAVLGALSEVTEVTGARASTAAPTRKGGRAGTKKAAGRVARGGGGGISFRPAKGRNMKFTPAKARKVVKKAAAKKTGKRVSIRKK